MKRLLFFVVVVLFSCSCSPRINKLTIENDGLKKDIKLLTEQMALDQRDKYVPTNNVRKAYDDLIYDLKNEIRNKDINIGQLRDHFINNMSGKVLFDSGEAQLSRQGQELLDKVGTILRGITDQQIIVKGYTDNVPIGTRLKRKYNSNWELARDRATQVAEYLVINTGLDPGAISICAYADTQPFIRENSAQENAHNRRVEISLSPVVKSIEGLDYVQTDNYENKKLYFYYYIPKTIINVKEADVFVCLHGLTGGWWDFCNNDFKRLAEEEHMILISLSFNYDEANWKNQKSYQYPEVWSGQAFLDSIQKVKEIGKIETGKLYFFGYAAGAQFALRFTLWKPELCAACVAYASGSLIAPKSTNKVKYLLGIGRQDTSNRINNMRFFYRVCRANNMDVVYKEYEGDHDLSEAQKIDGLNFIREAHPDRQINPSTPRAKARRMLRIEY